jgi:hypothetical protein
VSCYQKTNRRRTLTLERSDATDILGSQDLSVLEPRAEHFDVAIPESRLERVEHNSIGTVTDGMDVLAQSDSRQLRTDGMRGCDTHDLPSVSEEPRDHVVQDLRSDTHNTVGVMIVAIRFVKLSANMSTIVRKKNFVSLQQHSQTGEHLVQHEQISYNKF